MNTKVPDKMMKQSKDFEKQCRISLSLSYCIFRFSELFNRPDKCISLLAGWICNLSSQPALSIKSMVQRDSYSVRKANIIPLIACDEKCEFFISFPGSLVWILLLLVARSVNSSVLHCLVNNCKASH